MNERTPANPDTPSKIQTIRNKWLNPRGIRFWATTLILLYTLVGFLLVPYLLKTGLINYIEGDLGRSAHIEKIEFNPYALSLKVVGLEIKDTDTVRLVAFDQFFVNFQLSSLINRAWTFDEISLRGPYFFFERYDADTNRFSQLLDDASAGQAEQPEVAEEVEKGGLPPLLIHNLILSDGRGHLKDNVPDTPVELELGPINIAIGQLNTLPDRNGQQDVTIKFPEGMVLHWEGSLDLAPLDSEGEFVLENSKLARTIPYLKTMLPLEAVDATLSSRFRYRVHVEDDGTTEAQIDNLEIELEDVALNGLTPTTDFLSFKKIALQGGTLRYPEQTLQFSSLHIEEPNISAWLNKDGSLSLEQLAGTGDSDVVTKAQTDTSQNPADNPETPWQLGVDLISINQGNIDFADQSIDPAPRFNINSLNVKLTDFTTDEGAQLPLSVSGKLRAGGHFNVDGSLNILPEFSLNLNTKTMDIPLSIGQPYVQQSIQVLIEGGVLNSDLNISIPSGQAPSIAGSIQIPGLDIKDAKNKKPLVAWKAFALNRLELDLNTNKLDISALDFEQLYTRFAIHKDLSTNVSELMVEDNTSSAEPKTESTDDASAAPMQVVVGGINIKNAALDFSDASLPLPFAAHIDKLDGTISTFATNSSESSKVKLEGQVNEYGLARIQGDMNLIDPLNHTDIALEFRNLDMSRMSPYSGQFAGRKIKDGKLTLDLNYAIEKGIMDGKNDIILSDLLLGEKVESPNATSLPLDLAIALLKDPDGIISAKLPVTGDVNDPEFALGGIIWEAFVGIITDVVTAPFRFLGNMLGIDSEDLGQFQFLAGRADLTPPELEKITQLEEALTQRPQLDIEIAGTFDSAIDVPALQFITLRNTVIERLGESLSMENKETMLDDEIRSTLEILFKERFPDIPLKTVKAAHKTPPADDPDGKPQLDELAFVADLRDRLLAAQLISDQQLTDLANARAEAIKAAFLSSGNIDEVRVKIIDSKKVESKDGEWVTLELSVAP